jgi:hypothetical protein
MASIARPSRHREGRRRPTPLQPAARANIKITPDDKVKVLDFGLAKTMDTEPSRDVANSPTLSMMATNAGIILGTAAYMSPEQAKAFPADHRSDVFSFGVVVYEMLTGRQPFQGETAPDILASVLVREPDLQRLPFDLNPRIAELLRRCLEKSPKRRWQAMSDLRAELEAVASSPRAVLQIAVNDAALVRRLQRFGGLQGDAQGFLDGERPPQQPLGQRLAFDQLHDQEVLAVPLLHAVERGNVRMVDRREHFGFAFEPRHPVRVGAEALADDFDRDAATELAVAGAVDLAHSARSDHVRNFVRAKPGAGRQRHEGAEL